MSVPMGGYGIDWSINHLILVFHIFFTYFLPHLLFLTMRRNTPYSYSYSPSKKGEKGGNSSLWQRRRFERICYSIFQETLNVKIKNPPTVAKFHNLFILTKRIFWRTIFRNGNKSSIPFFFFRKIQKFKIRQNMPPDPVGKQWKFCNFANFVLPWEPESFFSLATSSFVHHRLTRLRPKVEDTSSIFKT